MKMALIFILIKRMRAVIYLFFLKQYSQEHEFIETQWLGGVD